MFDFIMLSSAIECGLGLLFVNIIIYVILTITIFLILLILDNWNFNSLNKLHHIFSFNFYRFSFFVTLLSLAGVPPLLGFIGKFLLFFYLIACESIFIVFLFTTVNIFALYFYVQNTRFVVTKNTRIIGVGLTCGNSGVEIPTSIILIIIIFNFTGLLFIEDFIINSMYWFSFLL